MNEENCNWIFVNMVPMLCAKTRIDKQQKVETWLNLYQLAKELNLEKPESHRAAAAINYVV